jgi:hypothetical protein
MDSIGNPVFGIEIRGFEHIPDAERNMTLPQVGPLWLATNLNVLSIILGCVGITLGLSLWWALAACIVGNLPFVYLGLGSIGTVRAGLPVTTLSRAVFGIRGNIFNAALGWIASVAYEVIGAVFGVYALLALFNIAGRQGSGTAEKLLAIFLQLVLSGGIAMLGHATMVFLQRFAALALGAVLLIVLIYTCGQVDWAAAGTSPYAAFHADDRSIHDRVRGHGIAAHRLSVQRPGLGALSAHLHAGAADLQSRVLVDLCAFGNRHGDGSDVGAPGRHVRSGRGPEALHSRVAVRPLHPRGDRRLDGRQCPGVLFLRSVAAVHGSERQALGGDDDLTCWSPRPLSPSSCS